MIQSIVGFDAIVLYHTRPKDVDDACRVELTSKVRTAVEACDALWSDALLVAASLIMGTFHALPAACTSTDKLMIWDVIDELLVSAISTS